MSIQRGETWINCDFCGFGVMVENQESDRAVRRTARTTAGFKRVKHWGKLMDICPNCYASGAHRQYHDAGKERA